MTTTERNGLIEKHFPLARKLARAAQRRLPRSIDYQDLEQTAYLGLVKAAERFQRRQGAEFPSPVPFGAYARFVVWGALMDSNRRQSYAEATMEQIGGQAFDKPGFEACTGIQAMRSYVPSIDEYIDQKRVRASVRRAAAVLPRLSLVIVADAAAGRPLESTARAVGVDRRRLAPLRERAFGELRRELQANGVTRAA